MTLPAPLPFPFADEGPQAARWTAAMVYWGIQYDWSVKPVQASWQCYQKSSRADVYPDRTSAFDRKMRRDRLAFAIS